MNELMAALGLRSFDRLLKAYLKAGVDLHDMIDGGAGSGKTAAEMLPYMNTTAKVHAFEPFPGNHRFFENADPRVTLIPRALAEEAKTMTFAVSSVVAEDSMWGRRGMAGYSSVGKLVDERPAGGQSLTVDCVRADAVVAADRRVGFIKLDLQGGELNALKGCTRLLDKVALMWVEYSGQTGLYDFLVERDFMLFDTEYLFIGEPTDKAREVFHVARANAVLSTNKKAWFGFRKKPWKDFQGDMAKCKKELSLVQTDLVCINRRFLREFTSAVPHI